MLSFLKKIFGSKPADKSPAPYKVEAGQFPFPKVEKEAKKPAVKKPAAKTKTSRKPRAPKA